MWIWRIAMAGVLATATAASAEGITLRNPVAFRAQMTEMGYAPDSADTAADGTTVTFVLHLKDETLAAVLAGCTAGLNCTHLVLVGSFTDVAAPAAWVAERNKEYDLIKVWLRDDGKVTYGAGAAIEGLPRETFKTWIERISASTDELARDAIKAGYGPKK